MKQLFFDAAYLGKLHWSEPGEVDPENWTTR
jgi:hypothetical protein